MDGEWMTKEGKNKDFTLFMERLRLIEDHADYSFIYQNGEYHVFYNTKPKLPRKKKFTATEIQDMMMSNKKVAVHDRDMNIKQKNFEFEVLTD